MECRKVRCIAIHGIRRGYQLRVCGHPVSDREQGGLQAYRLMDVTVAWDILNLPHIVCVLGVKIAMVVP